MSVVVAAADKAYSDISILSRRLSGFDVDVFGSISEQVRMANEARSHLFIRPGEGDRNVDKKATADASSVESRESQRDDRQQNERAKVSKHDPRQHHDSPHQPSSHSDSRSNTHKVVDQPDVRRRHNRPVTGEEKQERKPASKTESTTTVSTHKHVHDDHVSKLKKASAAKQRSQSLSHDDCNVKSPDLAVGDGEQWSEASTDNRLQLASDQPLPENSEAKVKKKSSESKNEKKVSSHYSTRSQSSGMKSDDRKVKSVVAKSSAGAWVGSGVGRLSSNGSSSTTETDGELTGKVLCLFDEVHCLVLYFVL